MNTSIQIANAIVKTCVAPTTAIFATLLSVSSATPAHAAGVLELQGNGVQIYRCAVAGRHPSWTLLGPDATLTAPSGKPVGHHFAGPTWQALDGSAVVGEPVASGTLDDPAPTGVPWLVLRAKTRSGKGVFDAVTFVTRTRTTGGVAPADGCDAAHAGAEVRVPYSAAYTFFGVNIPSTFPTHA